jgi:hypothetical protein
MAAHALDMYRIAKGDDPASYRALGTDFWNLGAHLKSESTTAAALGSSRWSLISIVEASTDTSA